MAPEATLVPANGLAGWFPCPVQRLARAGCCDAAMSDVTQPAPIGYPVEVQPPDIASYRVGNTGVPYYTTIDSGRPGPHVLINAVTHGNELCGAIAVDNLLRRRIRPRRGRLSFGFANIAAYHRFDPARPGEARYMQEDLNRLWSSEVLDGPRRSLELDRAREIRPLIDSVDLMLDIHSMQHPTPPLMLAGPLDKGRRLAVSLGYPSIVVCDPGHDAGRRLRDYGPFGDPSSSRNALLVECGQHWQKASATVAIECALRFLVLVGAIGKDEVERPPAAAPAPPRVIEVTDVVTIKTDRFHFDGEFIGMEVVPKAGTTIAADGGQPVVTPYPDCVLIMPSRRLQKGQTAVRLGRFIN